MFKGIRFYTTERIPLQPEFKKSEFTTVGGQSVEFFFYREVFTDYVKRFGRIDEVQYVAYSIRMQVDETMPEFIRQHNNLKIVFKYDSLVGKFEDDLDRELLSQYIEFFKNLIEKQK
jgi:hypothetical protein